MINTDTRNTKFQILRKSDLFNGLTDNELLELASMAVLCAFTKGSIIFREGDQPEYIFIVGEGRIKFFSNSLSGRTIGAGVSEDIIGIHNLLTNEPRWLCTEALDDVIGLKLSRQDFLSYIKNKPMIQLKFLMRADKVLQLTYNRLKVLVDCSADQRVIDILYGLHEKFGSLLPFRIEEIASLAGLTRETTTRITRCLVKNGIIESGRKGVRVVDIDRLKVLKQYSPII